MTGLKILIVEDDKMLGAIFEMFLTDMGHQTFGLVQTADEALEICRKKPVDVILMDIHLNKGLTGVDVSELIENEYNIPIVYITGNAENDIIKRAICKNTYGFLQKPVYSKALAIAIEFAYQKHEFNKQLPTN